MLNIRGAITLLLAAASSVGQAQTPTKTWDGFVTDTHCGTNRHAHLRHGTPDRARIRLCVRKGSRYGLCVLQSCVRFGNHSPGGAIRGK